MINDPIDAIFLLEGSIDGTDEERIEAMQYLIDSGLIHTLQGSYQRLAQRLIEEGICTGA